MKNGKWILAGLVLFLALGNAHALGIDQNEAAAFLVFPGVVAAFDTNAGVNVETFITFTNTSDESINAHVAFINGATCNECNFNVPLTGQDTETLVLIRQGNVTLITNLDTGAVTSCSQSFGFITVNVENESFETLTANYLNGEEIVVDYANGAALSVEAVSIQGESPRDPTVRQFDFDGVEYRSFPSALGADFLAPDFQTGPLFAHLVLFTLAFRRNFIPLTDCGVAGFDAFETQFSGGFQFGCWTVISLDEISSEFAWPWLGNLSQNQDHGWLQLNCTVYGTDPNPVTGIIGGVHGAIVQYARSGAVLRRATTGPALANAAAWGRLLYQSGTLSDPLSYVINSPARGGTF
jgi:hypothetical protein